MIRECVVLKIAAPTKRKRALLASLQERYTRAVQYALDFSLFCGKTSNLKELHTRCYRNIRDWINLPSSYTAVAIRQAQSIVSVYWGAVKSRHFKKVSWPTVHDKLPLGLGVHSYRLFRNGDRWTLRVTTGLRCIYIWLPLCVPKKYQDTMSLAYGSAKLYERDNKWYVQLPIRYPIDTPTVSDGAQFFGVDLGIAKTATMAGPNIVKFWSGKAIQNRRRRFYTYRQRMKHKGRLDKIRATRGKERLWARDVNHKISRELVNIVAGTPGGTIVLEKLEGIRGRVRGSKRFNRMIANWGFRQLADMIVYKSKRAGVPIMWIDPRGTSQMCSRCGHASRANRPDQAQFRCVSCGYQANSDYNAARNIAAKGEEKCLAAQLDENPNSPRGLHAPSDALPGTARTSSEVPGAHHNHLMTA